MAVEINQPSRRRHGTPTSRPGLGSAKFRNLGKEKIREPNNLGTVTLCLGHRILWQEKGNAALTMACFSLTPHTFSHHNTTQRSVAGNIALSLFIHERKPSALMPIKAYSRKGFVIGWIAIVAMSVLGFGIATLPLGHSNAELEIANRVVSPVFGPSS